MVGVPGRSKACVTCLKRKKRCDLQKPFCGTCRKACIECGGYYRPRIFINNTVQNPDTTANAATTITYNPVAYTRTNRTMNNNDNNHDDDDGAVRGSVDLLPSLTRSAYQTKYLDLFWGMYLPNGRALAPVVTQNILGGWFDIIHRLHTTDPVLKKMVLAMSLTTIGKIQCDRALREEGTKLYATSLQNAAVALRNPRGLSPDGLLTAIRLFSLYESMHGADARSVFAQTRSWVVHNMGDAAFMIARTPYAFVSGEAHTLFADGRMHLTISALGKRQKNFLGEPAWMTIPWTGHKKSPRDHVVDILIDISPLFQGMDAMKATKDTEERAIARTKLVVYCLQLKKRLLQWHSDYAPEFEPGDEPPEVVSSATLAAAYLMNLYWTTSLIVYSNFNSLIRPGDGVDLDIDLGSLCRDLLKTVRFFLHPTVGLFRVHLATLPLSVVYGYFRTVEPDQLATERQLLAACLENPAAAGTRRFIEGHAAEFAEFMR